MMGRFCSIRLSQWVIDLGWNRMEESVWHTTLWTYLLGYLIHSHASKAYNARAHADA